MASEADRLSKFETLITSEDPEVVAPAAQLAYPNEPEFLRLDTPITGLSSPSEIQALERTIKSIETVREFVPFLYTYRSLSRAVNKDEYLKPAQDDQQGGLAEKYTAIYSMLFKSRLDQMFKLKQAITDSCAFISETAARFASPSDALLRRIIELMEILFNIDQMKLLKSGLTNDLSTYRRQKGLIQEEIVKTGELQPFLAQRYQTLEELKKMNKSTNTVDFWNALLNYCTRVYKRDFVLPQEKGAIVTAIVSTFFINDQRAFSKEIIGNCCQIIEENPLLPIYAELNFMPGQVMELLITNGFQPPKGVTFVKDKEGMRKLESQFTLVNQQEKFRDVFKNNLTKITQMAKDDGSTKIQLDWILNTIRCVSDMARAVMNQFAYKCACPATPQLPEGEKPSVYDTQVKFNYSSADLDALIEIIGNLKTMANFALRGEPTCMTFIYDYVAKSVQSFLTTTLDSILEAGKKDKDIENAIKAIRDVFGQFAIVSNLGEKKSKSKSVVVKGTVPPTIHQLDLLRLQAQTLISEGGPCADKKGKLKPFMKGKIIDHVRSFIDESAKFYSLLMYSQVIRESTNLGSLWFRETSLDIEQKLQYPVRSSLPFILSEHILGDQNRPALNDSVFFPFEIYNDAAYLAVNTFKSKFLYKEIEAELSLCVDMISVTFARAFFRLSRESAAAAELPPECAGLITPSAMRFGLMVKQNSLQLLGSPVDFNLITSRLLNSTFQKEIEKMVKDMTDLRAVPYVAHIFRVLKCTHRFLTKSGLRLDPFDMIYKKAITATDPCCPFTALTTNLINAIDPQRWQFNSRIRALVPKKAFTLSQPSNEKWCELYNRIHKSETAYIGGEHYAAIVDILTDFELTVFIQACISRLEEEIKKTIEYYTAVAATLRIFQVRHKDDLNGFFNFVTDAYSETKHPKLAVLFNSMRVVGNLTVLLYGLECELKIRDTTKSIISTVINIYKEIIEDKKDLFIPRDFDYESQLTHRAFSSLWCALEWLLCCPGVVQLSDSIVEKQPIRLFGEGPVVFAQILISLSGQRGLYEYDSIINTALGIYGVQKISLKNEIGEFIHNASHAYQASNFAQTLVHPYAQADLSNL